MKHLVFLCTIFTFNSFANNFYQQKKASEPRRKNLADRAHLTVSRSLINMADSLDSFFGDRRMDEEANDTRIRVYSDTRIPEGELATTEGNYQIQLSLPKTEKRFQLILERENNQNLQDDNQARSSTAAVNAPGNANENENRATQAGIRFLLDKADINFSTDFGVRTQIPPLLFGRMRVRKNISIGDWVFRPVEQISWLQDEGFASRTDLNFDYKLDDAWLFRLVNNIRWNDQDYIITTRNGPTFLHQINERIGMSYNFITISSSSPMAKVDNYVFSIGYRQLLYKDWFFWEVSPNVAFPRTKNFHRTPGWNLRFEIIVGRV